MGAGRGIYKASSCRRGLKQHLAAIRRLFDRPVTLVSSNSTYASRGPEYVCWRRRESAHNRRHWLVLNAADCVPAPRRRRARCSVRSWASLRR